MLPHITANRKKLALPFGCAVFFILLSCEDAPQTNGGSNRKDFPTQVIENADIVEHDSGSVKIHAMAPVIEKYELVDSPYVLAKKGITIEFFDKKNPNKPGKITAKFARMDEKSAIYFAKGDVRISTAEGRLFATQTIYWNQQAHKMYTRDTVYVTDSDGSTLIGKNGMVASDDFSTYTFYNNTADFNVKNLPAQSQ